MRLSLLTEILPYAHYGWKRCTYHDMTAQQEQDFVHFVTYRKSGIFASRGYGKTLMCVILESFMAARGWITKHLFKELSQATQWWAWFRKLGWKVTLWHATWGTATCKLGLYTHKRGSRVDLIINDEIGTVISQIERLDFGACQDMLSGSPLGMAKYCGTRDPNSLQSKYAQNVIIRPYDPLTMPWVTMQYNDALLHNSVAFMDCEYHMKATPFGGLVLQHVEIIHDFPPQAISESFGLDTNPDGGYYATGTFPLTNPYTSTFRKGIYITDTIKFNTLAEVATFVCKQTTPVYIENNGVGLMMIRYLEEQEVTNFVSVGTTETNKYERICNIATRNIFLRDTYDMEVYECLTKQIWKDKTHIEKFKDAHWFDSLYIGAGIPSIAWT